MGKVIFFEGLARRVTWATPRAGTEGVNGPAGLTQGRRGWS